MISNQRETCRWHPPPPHVRRPNRPPIPAQSRSWPFRRWATRRWWADRIIFFSIFRLPIGAGFTRRPRACVWAASFTPDGKRILVAIARDLYFIDSASGDVVQKFPRTSLPVDCVAVSPDGRMAASGSYDELIQLRDLESRINTRNLSKHTGWVRAVAFLPDGHTLVSASEDNTVRLRSEEH